MARATKRQAQSALRAVRRAYGYGTGEEGGPRLVDEYHGWYNSYPNAIVWENGPYEWAVAVSCGCGNCAAEGLKCVTMPKGTYAEAIDNQAFSLYRV